MYLNTQIRLESMRFYSYHGMMPQERSVGNYFDVTLTVDADVSRAGESDELSDTIDYGKLYEMVKHEMDTPSRLLEHVAARITRKIFAEFLSISGIKLKITKLTPPFGGEVKGASVIFTSKRDE